MKHIVLFLLLFSGFSAIAQNVGVGNVNPQSRLHVSGQIRTDSSLIIDTVEVQAAHFIMVPEETGFLVVKNTAGKQHNQMMLNGNAKTGQVLFIHNEDDDTVFFNHLLITPLSTSLMISDGISWHEISGQNATSMLSDRNGNTRVWVEKRPDEDKVRIDIEGDSAVVFDKTSDGYNRMYFNDNGRSVFIGERVGDSLDMHPAGNGNVAIGNMAFTKNRDGYSNVAVGNNTLMDDVTGYGNTAIGHGAGFQSQGEQSTLLGWGAGASMSGVGNAAIGVGALERLGQGDYNNVIGYEAAMFMEKGTNNSIVGNNAAKNADSMHSSVLIGHAAGQRSNGQYNIFIGDSAGHQNEWSNEGNVFIGRKSGAANTSEQYNTYVGNLAGASTSPNPLYGGDRNTFFGYSAGTEVMGSSNTFLGAETGLNLKGSGNVLVGSGAATRADIAEGSVSIGSRASARADTLWASVVIGGGSGSRSDLIRDNVYIGSYSAEYAEGERNVVIGSGAFQTKAFAAHYLQQKVNGSDNVVLGNRAAYYGVGSNENVVIGNRAASGINCILGNSNIIFGSEAASDSRSLRSSILIGNQCGFNASSTQHSVFIGDEAGYSSSADYSTHIGYQSGKNSTGSENVFIGTRSAENNTSASHNIALGYRASFTNETGSSNITLGADVLFRNLSGSRNIAIGDSAGFNNRSSIGNNIFIGHGAGKNELGNNKLVIENSASNTPLVYGDFANDYLSIGGDLYTELLRPKTDITYDLGNGSFRWRAVYALNGTVQTSDRRHKKNIQDLGYGLQEVLEMRAVSYEWKHDSSGQTKVGFIAQELEQIVPEVVVVGSDSLHTRGVNYAELIPVLVKAIQEQEQVIGQLKDQNAEQANALQLLSARLTAIESSLQLSTDQFVKQ